MSIQPILRTARLRLRPFIIADAAAVQILVGEREVADTTQFIPHPYPEGEAESWIRTHAQEFIEGTAVVFAVVRAADGELVGCIELAIDGANDVGTLGYWVGRRWWNQGIATEAGREVVRYGFTDLSLHRIQADHLVRNPASGRVLAKLGLVQEGIIRGRVKRWGVHEDVATWGILRRDHPVDAS